MSLFDDPSEFDRIVRSLRETPVLRQASRFDLARLLASSSLMIAKPDMDICVPDVDPNAPPASSFFILLSGDYKLDGEARVGGPRDGLVGIEDVIKKVPRSIKLTATSAGLYLEVKAAAFLALLGSSTPLRQSLVPILKSDAPPPPPNDFVEPAEYGGKGSIVQFVTTITDTPLSLIIELLAREIAMSFSDHVIVLRACPQGQAPSPSPIKVLGPGLGELYYMFIDPNITPDAAMSYCTQYDYVILDGVPSSVVDTVVKLFFGYPQDYVTAPPAGSPRVLQTEVVGQPPLPCSKELYYVNANPSKMTHSSDCRVRLDLGKLRAMEQGWNAYLPLVNVDVVIMREMGVLARALTHRRTGIALAGGGVWSMQSVYIIRELTKKGVPLDVLTGTSAGAMIGAYYANFGLPGLDMVVERGDSGVLDVVVTLWSLSGCFSQAFFEMEFGAHTCLDNLLVDFRPNSTNLTAGEGVAFIRGPLATAVRAAASAPPLMPPAFNGETRFVDGAFTNNLAAQILPYFGANLTFGANTYPPSRRPKPPWVPNIVARATSLGPINRMFDFTVALNLLANLTGRVEGGFADVAYNAEDGGPFPFLTTSNFCKSSEMVAKAEKDLVLQAKIDEFVMRWNHLCRRGERTWTTSPS